MSLFRSFVLCFSIPLSSIALASDVVCSVEKEGATLFDDQFLYDVPQKIDNSLLITVTECSGKQCTIYISTDASEYQYIYKKGPTTERYGVDGYSIFCKDSDFVAIDKGLEKAGDSIKESFEDLKNKF
jgi:hypothetical protein